MPNHDAPDSPEDLALRRPLSVMRGAILEKVAGTNVVLAPRRVRGIRLGNGSLLRKYIAETKVKDMLDPPE